MLKATYENNTYNFYVTIKDAQQWNNTGAFPIDSLGIIYNQNYLFKLTNDMSGAVKYAYAKIITENDRYFLLQLFNSSLADENIYEGKVNLEQNGYWKYEIYWMYEAIKVVPNDCDRFNPLETGTWQCTDIAGTVIDAGTLNTDQSLTPVYVIDNLIADTYSIEEYSTCNPPPFNQPSTPVNTILYHDLLKILCITSSRELLFTKVERALDTVDFTITSNTAIGKEIRFTSDTRTYSHIVTTLPETVVMTVETSTGIEDIKKYVVEIYDAGVLYQTYNNVTAVRKPQQFRGGYIMASNNEYEAGCGFGTPLGSIFFTWNGTGNSPNGGYITEFQAPIEIGKLLIEEPQGDEQVRYTQHESPDDTNYIYNE
jgi:hypothetical protein